ncbi:MAG: hypothetical protein K2X93_21560 [Candidatus Obscuribacterales bacterium]|nr:hypothetical protein [Candidatus Obscuribacterales bacterium]
MTKATRVFPIALAALFASSLLCGFASKDTVGEDVHGSVIKEGLAGTICPTNIEVIINGSQSQDSPTLDAAADPQRHFDGKSIARSYDYIKREQRKVLNYCSDADSNSESRTRALYHFGMMLHTAQDFYSNTNYLKLKVEELDRTTDGAYDPYSIELVDWTRLGSKHIIVAGHELRVETARNAVMALPLQESTYGKVARGLAIRETMRQWTFLESLLTHRYGERAKTILIGLTQASCINKVPKAPEDTLDSGD